ncbi:hypothetical protein E2R62_15880 [Citrobacter rodentium]|uniref:Uncharacterized protein n=1 Tax=Citrobacter rodentium TaxID=67825 RepID=A0A482PVU7_CITRO|nr:hypothetical protein E2R62_15880 [Citrobacter rodentium]
MSTAPSGKLAPDGGVPPYPAYNRSPAKRAIRRPDKRSAIRQISAGWRRSALSGLQPQPY